MKVESDKNFQHQDVVFFSLAEEGAMGCPGNIFLAVKSKDKMKWYSYNTMEHCYEELVQKFPAFREFNPGLFGMVSSVPEGWKHVYLGFGNHLLVREDYYQDFQEQIAEFQDAGEIYANWMKIAENLLGNERKEKKGSNTPSHHTGGNSDCRCSI